MREAVGPHFGIGVDFHGRVHRPMAKVLAKELEPFKLMFIEEPVLSEHAEALKEIANHCSTPIALGERLYSRWDFKRILADGYVDIIQPDPSHAGGITETRKIAAMAEAYDVALALHCPLGPIALAACLQLDAVCYNAFIQEQSLGIHYNKTNDLLDYVKDPSVFDYRRRLRRASRRGPGLGIEVNEDVVERDGRGPAIAGAIPSGATPTAASPSGERHRRGRRQPADALPLRDHGAAVHLRRDQLPGPQQHLHHRARHARRAGLDTGADGLHALRLRLDVRALPDSRRLAGGPRGAARALRDAHRPLVHRDDRCSASPPPWPA